MIDLQQFCSDSGGRYNTHRPFVRGRFRWATDMRFLVRVPCDEPDTVVEHGKLPKVMDVWAPGFKAQGDFVPLPALRYQLVGCEECNGTGMYICPTCSHEDDCSECDGSGEVFSPWWLKIGANIFSVKLLDKLCRLPGITVALQGEDELGQPISFRCDGAEGLLMPGDKAGAIRDGKYSESTV